LLAGRRDVGRLRARSLRLGKGAHDLNHRGADDHAHHGLLMAFKLLDMAQQRWRRLDGAHLLPLVRAGTNFIDGVQEDRAKNVTQSTENEPREAA
jgi:hypothetical protein